MSRKVYTVLSILLVAAFALAACGTPTAHAAPATAAPATAAPKLNEENTESNPTQIGDAPTMSAVRSAITRKQINIYWKI